MTTYACLRPCCLQLSLEGNPEPIPQLGRLDSKEVVALIYLGGVTLAAIVLNHRIRI